MFFTESRKSQAAIFIVIGVIILAVFGFIAYKQSEAAKNRISPSISTSGSALPKSSPVYEYISRCFDQASARSLYVIGLQGGYFFNSQTGSIITWPVNSIPQYNNSFTNSVSNVSYLLWDTYADPVSLVSNPYPCSNRCIDSSNNAVDLGAAPLYCSFLESSFSCKYGTYRLPTLNYYSGAFSLTEQIQNYTGRNFLSCLDLDLINSKLTGNATLEKENILVDVVFGENDVTFSAKIPVVVILSSGVPVTEFIDFKSAYDVRFRKIYELLSARGLIMQDINSLAYSVLVNGTAAAEKFSPRLEVKVHHNAYGHDDVIMIVDNSSVLNGNPYVFQYARKNRAPVLNTIHSPQFYDVDVVALPDEILMFNPEAFDPDEDKLTYSYSGWNEDLLVNSDLFRQTNKSAEIIVSSSDAGLHNVTVAVSDGQFSDWQTVRVLVAYFSEENVCRNGIFGTGKKVYYPDHPDASGVEVGFDQKWSGCANIDELGTSACVGDRLLQPANKCCSIFNDNGVLNDPCVVAGYDPICILSATRGCNPDTCTVHVAKTGLSCDAFGAGKTCQADGTCA